MDNTDMKRWVKSIDKINEDLFTFDAMRLSKPYTGTVIDIGSNVGSWVNHFLTCPKYSDIEHIIALEPAPHCVEYLENTYGHEDKVTILAMAAYNRTAFKKFTLSGNVNNIGLNQFSNDDNGIIVRCDTLDNILLPFPDWNIEFIKIDVEKAEIEVLQGMKRILTTFKPDLLVEIEPGNEKTVIEILAEFNYTKHPIQVMKHDWFFSQ